MQTSKAHILAQLQKEILPLEGYKPIAGNKAFDGGLGFIKNAFPNASFPLGAIHEFYCSGTEDVSASSGFIAGVVSAICNKVECHYGSVYRKPFSPLHLRLLV